MLDCRQIESVITDLCIFLFNFNFPFFVHVVFVDLPPLRLMYAGKSLDLDEKTLSHYGIQDVSYSDGA